MGSPGFYGPIGAPDIIDNDETRGANSHKSSATTQGEPTKEVIISEDRKDNCGPTREAFMDPEFGGFYDDLAAGPPTENIPPGEMRFEKGTMGVKSGMEIGKNFYIKVANYVPISYFHFLARARHDGCRISIPNVKKL